MASKSQTKFEEKRFALRMVLHLPIIVSGNSEDGMAWSEPTETEDISTNGAFFSVNQIVRINDSLRIRSHRPDGVPVEVTAQVMRVAPGNYGSMRVGVTIVEARENWMRLFVSWVADEQNESSK